MSKTVKKKQPFFSPDKIVTMISQALTRDLYDIDHEYDIDEASLFYRKLQSCDFKKKYVSFDAPVQDELEQLTFQKFLKVNDHMSAFREINPPEVSDRVWSHTSRRDKILLRARALMHSVLGEFWLDEWFTECKHSSGSSVGVPFSDTSLERKFTFPITTTERAKTLFDQYLSWDFTTAEAVKNFNSQGPVMDWYKVVHGSRATTVEKNDSIRRMICVEPTANMFLQQGLMQMMYNRMKAVGLDVESLPDTHRKLARESSITRRNATIDWSSASDCVSIGLLKWLLPPKWFSVVNDVRSSVTDINGDLVELNMFATMGNAVTFPLETLVFWTMAVAVDFTDHTLTNSMFPEWEYLERNSVFGDDCIVPSANASAFIECMTEVGFIINEEKSFYDESKFRESCGGDYLAGRDVRPYHVRAPTSCARSALEPWLYIIANSLIKKYILYFGELNYVYDKRALALIFSLFAKYRLDIKLVPSFYPDDSGLKISFDLERFLSNYSINLSRIYRSNHGTLAFNYCKFQYRVKSDKDGGLRVANWLKKPVQSERASLPWEWVRRKGGYVVGKSTSCHWHVPDISNVSRPVLIHRVDPISTKKVGGHP